MVKALLFLALTAASAFASPIELFENASIRDRDFIGKSFEAGKLYLSQGKVEKTLTISMFYRLNFLKDQKLRTQYFQEGFYQLEVFSLMKLCQWDHIDQLLAEYEAALKETNKSLEKFEELRKQIAQHKILEETVKETNPSRLKKNENFNKLVLYKVPHAILEHSNHPKDFTLQIENKCLKRF